MKKQVVTSMFLIFLLLLLQSVYAQNPCSVGSAYRNCKACGSAKTARVQQLNDLKNRDEKATNPQPITVVEIRKPANSKQLEREKFDTSMQVRVTGYVASVVPGGFKESCNCSRKDLQDIHINIVATPQERNIERRYVIVEFTPRWQEKFGLNNSNYRAMFLAVKNEIEHKWVTFEGWMFYDSMHENESVSTAPKNKADWRATPWEVHPVTSYTVLSGPPS